MHKIIAFVTYESAWFPAGGIAAVMGQLPNATQAASRLPTVVITPLHTSSHVNNKIPSKLRPQMQLVRSINVDYRGNSVPVAVYRYQAGCSWYFLETNAIVDSNDSFFAGDRHPYDLPRESLLRDSMFFGAASVLALAAIASAEGLELEQLEWNLIAQDWEAATALLAFASQKEFHGRLHLTLHNSYDEFATAADFSRVRIDPARCPGDTILDRALAIIELPAFTVSDQFAMDFTDDLLQREIMAPQLQPRLNRSPVIGVDNGPFKSLAVDQEQLRDAAIGNFGSLQHWKSGNRQKSLSALDAHKPTERDPLWGDKTRFRRDDAPWFVMAGRDDPRQKGYDVVAAAIENYLANEHGKAGCAQFLFFPIPGDEGLSGLRFLRSLADRYPEDVIAFPFIWIAGFTAALQGAAYGMMPSLYEPFGMANEFYLAGGCVGIARATGGNLEQIVPLRASAAGSRAVQLRADRFHSLSAQPTGILFREKDDIATARRDWGGINDANYLRAGDSRVEQRREYAVFREMANELRIAIEDGIRIFSQEPGLYYRMLAEGVSHIQRTFSWQRAGQEYSRKVG